MHCAVGGIARCAFLSNGQPKIQLAGSLFQQENFRRQPALINNTEHTLQTLWGLEEES